MAVVFKKNSKNDRKNDRNQKKKTTGTSFFADGIYYYDNSKIILKFAICASNNLKTLPEFLPEFLPETLPEAIV